MNTALNERRALCQLALGWQRCLRGALLIAVGSLMGFSCETDIIEDPGFQFWCDDTLCEWETRAGEIRRVPTWHQEDAAVEFIGDEVVIEQQFDDRCEDRVPEDCRVVVDDLMVSLIADVASDALVTMEVDFDGDARLEWQADVIDQGFVKREWSVDTQGLRDIANGSITLRKTGPGRAVIAQLRVFESR